MPHDSNTCACGEPLHYRDPHNEQIISEYVASYGATVKVVVGGRAWQVPRHYIALHGIGGGNLADVAQELGFEEVKP